MQTLWRASQGVDWSWSRSIKSHHAQMSSGKGLPSHFWNRNNVRSILPGLRRKRTGLLLSGPKSSFQIKVFCIYLEIKVWSLEEDWRAQNPSCLKSSVKFPKSVMIWGAVTSAGVGPLCFIKSKVNDAVYQEILEHFMLPSADKFYGDADFLFQQDFSTFPQSQSHFQVVCWPWYYCAWLESNMLTWTPYGIYGIFSRERWETANPTIQTSWRLNSAQQCHRLIASMPHLTDAGIRAKGAATKYWVHKWTYFKELKLFCFANPYFFIDLRKYLNILYACLLAGLVCHSNGCLSDQLLFDTRHKVTCIKNRISSTKGIHFKGLWGAEEG